MKVVTLNIWGGSVRVPLLNFFRQYADVDVFCLQEVYHQSTGKISTDGRFCSLSIFDDIAACLPDHIGFFRPIVGGIYGLAMFVHKTVTVREEGDILIHEEPEYTGTGPAHPRNMQWMRCQQAGHPYAILNVHGLWNGQGKTDTPARLAQSTCIKTAMAQFKDPLILCGDFNLRPDTQSLAIIAENMQDLVKQYGVTCTRTSLYTKPERFADYIFTSDLIQVRGFQVLPEEVSDHAALWVWIK